MTRKQFDRLEDGVMVWFRPPYLAYRMPGVIRTINKRRGVWVNFFGDGQCHYVPQKGREDSSPPGASRSSPSAASCSP